MREKRKTIVLFLILLILSALSMGALAIGDATANASEALRKTLGGYFTLQNDSEYAGKQQAITDPLIDRIAAVDGIEAVNRMNVEYLLMNDLTLEPGRFTAEGDERAHMARFLGSTDSERDEYFVTRTFQLSEGRALTPDDHNRVLISRALAERNGLSVGDVVTARVPLDGPEQNNGSIYSWEVVGLFEVRTESEDSDTAAECDMPANFILADMNSMMRVQTDQNPENAGKYRRASFFVEDPAQLKAVLDAAHNLDGVDWTSLELHVNDEAYQRAAQPLRQFGTYMRVFVAVVIGVSVVLLSLLLFMWGRDRVHETGVLISIGVGKGSIVGQRLLEVLVVSLGALLVAFPVSGLVVGLGSNAFPEVLTQEEQADSRTVDMIDLRADGTDALEPAAPEVEVSVRVEDFMTIAAWDALACLVAVGISSLRTIRMKPKDILTGLS